MVRNSPFSLSDSERGGWATVPVIIMNQGAAMIAAGDLLILGKGVLGRDEDRHTTLLVSPARPLPDFTGTGARKAPLAIVAVVAVPAGYGDCYC